MRSIAQVAIQKKKKDELTRWKADRSISTSINSLVSSFPFPSPPKQTNENRQQLYRNSHLQKAMRASKFLSTGKQSPPFFSWEPPPHSLVREIYIQ